MRLTALFLTFAGLVAAQQGSSDVVISQIYGGGGNSGAQLRSDFIELFNRGRASVNISGWSVQYASANGTTWQVTPLQGSIEPGRYFLVKQADGANLAAPALPIPDAMGTIPMSGTAAKVAVVRNTIALEGARPTGANVVDLVGFGETNGFEGSAPVRALSNTTAAIRRLNGCQDTDDNAADFQTGIPAPRNSATTAAVDCSALPQARSATISEIQGSGARSPLEGQTVITRGTVTGVGTNGFWIQSIPADEDNNPATSEGVFVFTSSRPPATATRGALVQVTGTVTEFRPASDPDSPTLTELVDPVVEVQGGAQPLPAPVRLSAGVSWERYEGMRVSVDAIRTTSGTLGAVNETTATSTSNGVFFGVLPGAPTPYRTPDENETFEVLRVDTRAQGGTVLDVSAGATVTGLVGPLDFGFRTYTVVQDPTPLQVTGGIAAQPVFAPEPGQFTVASANLQRLFDEQDDPSTSDPVVNAAAVQTRIDRISRVIRETLRSPDVLAVEEVENEALLKRLATATGDYDAYLFEGNDIGGIDVGLMVKRGRVRVLSVTQEGKDTGPANDRLWDRPPLVARLEIGGFAFTAIVVHNRSLINAETATVAAKRRGQAEALRDIIATRAAAGEEVIVLGDFNMFQFDELINVIRSREPLTNLTDTLLLADNYTYIQDGVRQTLDHVLITEGLKQRLYRYQVAHFNAEFPDVARNEPNGLARISDHDIPVATFVIDPNSVQITPAGVTNAGSFLSSSLVPGQITTIFGRGLGGAQVLINGRPAQTVSGTATQISAIIPADLTGPTATLQVGSSNAVEVSVAAASPGVFGVLNQDSTVNTTAAPAQPGSIVQIFGTGGGTAVRIGGQTAELLYAGAAPGLPGVVQINARVPANLAPGFAPVVVSEGPRTSDLKTFITVR